MTIQSEFRARFIELCWEYKRNCIPVTLETNDSGVWTAYGRPYWYLDKKIKPILGSSSDRSFLEDMLNEVGVQYSKIEELPEHVAAKEKINERKEETKTISKE